MGRTSGWPRKYLNGCPLHLETSLFPFWGSGEIVRNSFIWRQIFDEVDDIQFADASKETFQIHKENRAVDGLWGMAIFLGKPINQSYGTS
mmetsp:Transcript_11331/g.23760  ORF Transcript_11331/g.23760 Transcript_11331/m.23760 type:complete len:90 (-) Transcript_11331:408-677(-)